MNQKKHLAFATLFVILLTPPTYLLLRAIYQLPVEASAEAVPIDSFFQGHFFLISFLFSLVVVFMLYSLVAFRRKPGEEGDGHFTHGSTGLEIAWTVIPLFAVIGFGYWGWTTLDKVVSPKPNEMVVNVTGQQWSWSFNYPEIGEFANSADLVLPVNRTILLEMEARDVIHSFWVPEFRVKQDLLPGRKTELRITPTLLGTYQLRCAEICGERHAYMLANVEVLSEADFQAWADKQRELSTLPPAEQGRQLAQANGCLGCHSLDGTVLVGPSWLGLFGKEETLADGSTVTVDENYLIESIYDPDAQIVNGFDAGKMPTGFKGQLSDQDVLNIIAYIKTLGESK